MYDASPCPIDSDLRSSESRFAVLMICSKILRTILTCLQFWLTDWLTKSTSSDFSLYPLDILNSLLATIDLGPIYLHPIMVDKHIGRVGGEGLKKSMVSLHIRTGELSFVCWVKAKTPLIPSVNNQNLLGHGRLMGKMGSNVPVKRHYQLNIPIYYIYSKNTSYCRHMVDSILMKLLIFVPILCGSLHLPQCDRLHIKNVYYNWWLFACVIRH